MEFVKKTGPGLLLCLVLAIPSWLLGRAFPVIGGPVFAILMGMILSLILRDRTRYQAGIAFTSKKILQYAVILLGFGLNLSEIAKVGAQSLSLIHISADSQYRPPQNSKLLHQQIFLLIPDRVQIP